MAPPKCERPASAETENGPQDFTSLASGENLAPNNTQIQAAQTALQIDHRITDDDANGAFPPIGDDGLWQIVRSTDGQTLWRRIALQGDGADRASAVTSKILKIVSTALLARIDRGIPSAGTRARIEEILRHEFATASAKAEDDSVVFHDGKTMKENEND